MKLNLTTTTTTTTLRTGEIVPPQFIIFPCFRSRLGSKLVIVNLEMDPQDGKKRVLDRHQGQGCETLTDWLEVNTSFSQFVLVLVIKCEKDSLLEQCHKAKFWANCFLTLYFTISVLQYNSLVGHQERLHAARG